MSADRTAFPAALRGLTPRGRAFLVIGGVGVFAAVLVGHRELLRLGLLLSALPLASAWAVSRTRFRLACTRELDPARVPAGAAARVSLRLDNVSRLPTGLLLVEDRVPYVLGALPRFVLDRVEPRGQRTVSYHVRSDVRGRFPLGPLSLRLNDPFGLCQLRRAFTARDVLLVTPVVQPLPTVFLGGEWSGSGESRSRSLAAAGEDDVGTREYRHGDALHRVHWRSTARYGELMVRREEQPWQNRCTLLLDTRGPAHRGSGPGSSFEWAVSAAASIGVHLGRAGYAVRLVTASGASVSSAAHDADGVGGDFEDVLLDALAVVSPTASTSLRALGPALRRGRDSLLVAVLGALDTAHVGELGRLPQAPGAAVALLLDVTTWDGVADGTRTSPGQAYDATAGLLTRSGWRVVRVSVEDDLAAVWPLAAGPVGSPAAAAVAGGT